MNTFCYIPPNDGPGYAEKYVPDAGLKTSSRHTAHGFIYFPLRKINFLLIKLVIHC